MSDEISAIGRAVAGAEEPINPFESRDSD